MLHFDSCPPKFSCANRLQQSAAFIGLWGNVLIGAQHVSGLLTGGVPRTRLGSERVEMSNLCWAWARLYTIHLNIRWEPGYIYNYIPAPLEFEVFFFQLKICKNPGEKFFLPKICTHPGGKFFLHNFSGLSLFLALPHHVMGSEAILASTWVNSITKRLSGIAMWAEHLEKRSRPFQKQIIHSASFPLLVCTDSWKQTWLSLASWA